MLENNKCLLVYGLSDEELNELKKENIKTLEISNEMASMRIQDIIDGLRILKYNDKVPKEKVVLFNSYADDEIKDTIKLVRNFITGGILAVVTPTSIDWTFEYLISHLIEEREWTRSKQKGR